MALVRTAFSIKYKPDEEKSVEENKEVIKKAVNKMIDECEENNYEITIEIGSDDSLDIKEVEEMMDNVESVTELIESVNLNTPVGIDEDGDPVFGVKKEDK